MSFRLMINNKEYGPTDDNSNTVLSEGFNEANLVDYTNWGQKSAWLIYPTTGYKYTLTFWYEYGGTMKFQLEKAKYYIKGDFNGWGETKELTGNGSILTATVSCWHNGRKTGDEAKNNGFKFTWGTNWYGKTGAVLSNNVPYTAFSYDTSEGNMMLDDSANGKEVTFTLTLENGVPKSLTASWSEPASILTARQLVSITDANQKFNPVDGSGATHYDYVTYPASDDVYGVNVVGTAITAAKLNCTADELNVIYGDGTKCEFTDEVLLMSPLPAQFTESSTQYPKSEIGEYTLYKAATAITPSKGGKQSDGSFCAIVQADNITEAHKYQVKLAYKYKPDGSTDLVEGGSTIPGQAEVKLVVPEPKLKAAKIELFHGTDNTAATDDATAKFRLSDGKIMTSRYNSLREYVEVEKPNVSANLQSKIDAAANPAYEVKFGDVLLPYGVFTGNVTEPSKFYKGTYASKTVKCTKSLPGTVLCYERWKDAVIDGIEVNLGAPQNVSLNIGSNDVSFEYGENGHLIETVNATLRLDGAETGNTVACGAEETVMACDNYLVSFSDNNGGTTTPLQGENAELVVSSNELKTGKVVTFTHDHGTWWDGIDEAVSTNCFGKRLRADYTMLYPFMTSAAAQPASAVVKPFRAEGESAADGDVVENAVVLKSAPQQTRETEDIVTSADAIAADAAVSVSAGVGYIEVCGASADIYAADGMKMASGEGRFSLSAGIYVVKTAVSVRKVIVR